MASELLDALLAGAKKAGASDIHLSAGHPPMMRVRGELRAVDTPPLSEAALRDILAALLAAGESPEDGAESAEDLDFARTLGPGDRYRINAYRTQMGTALAIRRLPAAPPPLEHLPAPESVRALAARENGLILLTGPTGSGKSTTMAALVDRVNETRRHHVITIEDPIEYLHANKTCLISQREVGRHTRSFHTALRAALREDPDIILVGEMRDLETISLALTAAETGQLVIASMHAPTAPQAVDRILDVFPGNEKELVRAMLATGLTAVITQRLLPRVDGGRAAAMEVMLGTAPVRNQIREGKIPQLAQTIELGRSAGMQTMAQSIAQLQQDGYVSAEVAAHWRAQFQPQRAGDDAEPDPAEGRRSPRARRR